MRPSPRSSRVGRVLVSVSSQWEALGVEGIGLLFAAAPEGPPSLSDCSAF